MNERLLAIFVELYGRMPTTEEIEEFREYLVLINQFGDEPSEPVELRAEQVRRRFGLDVEPVDVEEIYARFNHMIAGMKLDAMIQESVYFWKDNDDYYADNLDDLWKID